MSDLRGTEEVKRQEKDISLKNLENTDSQREQKSQRNRLYDQRKYDDMKGAIRRLEGLLEVAVLTVAYYLAWSLSYRDVGYFHYPGRGKYVLMGVYAILTVVLFLNSDSFKYGHMKLTDVVISQWIALVLVNTITYFQLCLIVNHMTNPLPMAGLTGIDMVLAFLCSYLFTLLYHRIYVPKRMLMIYGNEKAVGLKQKMDARADKYQIEKLISVEEGYDTICKEILEFDAVVINDVPGQIRNDILKFCYQEGVRTYMAPKISDVIIRGATDISLFDTPLLLVKGRGLTLFQRFVKRAMDICVTLLILIPGTPVMLVTAAAIKLEDHGPVFYKQRRLTKERKPFDILKFRSMIVDAEKEGKPMLAADKDPRITKVGRIIRATRLDELPQLLNILKGDMSLVGPRPERGEYVEKFMEAIPEYQYRYKVKGGLTGYAQIYGKYNTNVYDKLRMDLMYIENYSVILDIKLILMTLRIMLKPESTEGVEKNMEWKIEDGDMLRAAVTEIQGELPEPKGGNKESIHSMI